MTLAYDDANSKLIDVVTVAYVDDEPVEDNLVKFSKVKFGQNIEAKVMSGLRR